MASTYSSLKIQLMATGENSGTWGNVTNINLGTAIEEAIVGSADVAFTGADVTLTLTDSNSSQAARNLRLNLTGTSGGARQLIVPAIEKIYIVNNGLADTVTVKNSTGTGIAVPAGKTMYVYNDGTNVVDAITHLTSLTLGTPLAVTSGGTGSTTGVNLETTVAGVLPVANGGTGSATAAFSGANITSLNASNISSGVLAVAQGGTGSNTAAFSGANITNLNASAITSGTVPTARLGSGTANSTTFLRGDQTWATAGGTPSTADVLNATAGASVGAIGTYAWLETANTVSTATAFANPGGTAAGSSLRYTGINRRPGSSSMYIGGTSSAPAGTWRCMGYAYNSDGESGQYPHTLWLRIS